MRLLYDTVVSSWATAMAQLESSAPALVDLLGVRAVDTPQDAILCALRCVSPEGIVTTELDGVPDRR
jgi:ABC-type transporter Mla MlaB component